MPRPAGFPASAADVAAVLRDAASTPLSFSQLSAMIRHSGGRGDDLASQRYGDVRTWRGLKHLSARGIARRVEDQGWVLC